MYYNNNNNNNINNNNNPSYNGVCYNLTIMSSMM